jgi:hypothetical protein
VWAVDRAGNDTIFEFNYTAPKIATTPLIDSLLLSVVGADSCTSIVLKNKSSLSVTLDSVGLNVKDTTLHVESTIPTLPVVLNADDSLIANVCYSAVDTSGQYSNALTFRVNCAWYSVPLLTSGATPIILATDADFGSVQIGDTVCKEVTIRNIGGATLSLQKNWLLTDVKHYALRDTAQFPIAIGPGQSIRLNICYSPTAIQYDSADIHWATNLSGQFAHHNKDYSILMGAGLSSSGVEESEIRVGTLTLDLNPNPAKTAITLHIDAPMSGIASIGVYDVLGREVKQVVNETLIEGSHELGVDINDLPSGRYFVRLEIGGSVLTKELTICR